MARLEQLVEGVQDEQLRRQIEAEISALKERTRFGLVYERHLPETALIADPDLVEIGALVRLKQEVDKDATYRVVGFKGKKTAKLTVDGNGKQIEAPISDLFVVKPFGDAIYPALTPVDVVDRSGERPYHAVINGENFHALQLLAYLYEGQVDCLYLDPPYNTGARDWKYNNRYVDDNDSYRHSKWLSMHGEAPPDREAASEGRQRPHHHDRRERAPPPRCSPRRRVPGRAKAAGHDRASTRAAPAAAPACRASRSTRSSVSLATRSQRRPPTTC